MTITRDHERINVADAGAVALGVRDAESIQRIARARVDLFGLESIEACKKFHGLKREPIGLELQEWALATRGSIDGDEVKFTGPNLMTRLGLRRLGALWIGETATASQAINVTHCRIGVGNVSTAAATTDTDLGAAAGSGNRQFKLVDSVAQGSGANSGVTTIVATFGTGVANFTWNEWCLDGGTADGTTVTSETASTPGMQNHKISAALLTKSSSVIAVMTITVTIV